VIAKYLPLTLEPRPVQYKVNNCICMSYPLYTPYNIYQHSPARFQSVGSCQEIDWWLRSPFPSGCISHYLSRSEALQCAFLRAKLKISMCNEILRECCLALSVLLRLGCRSGILGSGVDVGGALCGFWGMHDKGNRFRRAVALQEGT
jgi:hypothetical protein